jgi:arylsulfatase A-like enzyme
MDDKFKWPAREETLSLYKVTDMPVPETWQDDCAGKPLYLPESRSRQQALTYGYDKKHSIQLHFQRYYAATTEMDAELGRVFDEVDAMGVMGQTYVIFTSDNGWMMGEHGFTSKVLAYEESIRVPLILAGPQLEGGVDDHLVLNIDIAPTILELAEIPVPRDMHGVSLVHLCRRQQVNWRDGVFYEAPVSELGVRPLYALRTKRWKYIQTMCPDRPSRVEFEELYDLKTDPYELDNLATNEEYSKVLKRLREELAAKRRMYSEEN